MKVAAVAAAILSVVAICVNAEETNGQRMARGLPPRPPRRRATGVAPARRAPSATPHCNSGSPLCCNSVQPSTSNVVQTLAGLLGIVIPPGIQVGLNCSPLTGTCPAQPVCCQNNQFNGLIAINCTPLNVNL